MNDFDTFWHEAKAALRVALQWFFLAVPMGPVSYTHLTLPTTERV